MTEEKLGKLKTSAMPSFNGLDSNGIKSVCKAVAKWLKGADDEQGQTLLLEAMQIEARATREAADVSGVLPVEMPSMHLDEIYMGSGTDDRPGLSFNASPRLISSRRNLEDQSCS